MNLWKPKCILSENKMVDVLDFKFFNHFESSITFSIYRENEYFRNNFIIFADVSTDEAIPRSTKQYMKHYKLVCVYSKK